MEMRFKELLTQIIQKYKELMEYSTKNSGLNLEGVKLMNYDINKITINRGGSYIESPTSLKSNKCTINPQNKNDNNCFQYALTVALNYEEINNHPEKLSKMRPFIYQYNWDEINFPSNQKDWMKFESNNKSIALNVLYISHNTKDIRHAYKSKSNLTREHQVILLIISDDGEKWHYLCVKKLSALLRGISSNHNGDVYCMNCFKSFRSKYKLEIHKKMCENHDYCYVQMLNNENKILEYKHSEKSKRAPFVAYSDLECLLQKTNDENSNQNKSTIKVDNHIPCGYSMYTQRSFDNTKNKLDHYRGEDCMKKFADGLKDHVSTIINYEKKNLIKLTEEEYENHKNQKVCYICNKQFSAYDEDKNYYKVKNYCKFTGKYQGSCHKICRSKFRSSKEIPVIFHNGSTYYYHFIINDLAISFKEYCNFKCLGEHSEKYITFSVPFKKDLKNNKSIK